MYKRKILEAISLMYLLFLLIGFLLISKFNLLLYLAFFVPLCFWIGWAKIKKDTWDISKKENRIMPLLFTFFYLFLLNLFWKNILITIFLVNVLVILTITKFWKISMHNYGLSAMAYLIYAFTSNIFLFSLYILLVFITGYARVYLKKHTYSQVLTGTLLGFIINYILIKFIWY